VPQTLDPDEVYSCNFSANVAGNAGDSETDQVTATISDDEDNSVQSNDTARVDIIDVPSAIAVDQTADPTQLPEPGGTVTYTVRVDNLSVVDRVTIEVLTDTVHGDLTILPGSTCTVTQELGPGDDYSCTFGATIFGNPGDSETNTVTAKGTDDDGKPVEASDAVTVDVINVPSTIAVTQLADPPQLPEPGGSVTFTVRVTNTNEVDSVTIETLTDTIHGDLTILPGSTCTVTQELDPDEAYVCTFSADVSGNAGDRETNIVTAEGTDDDGSPVKASYVGTVDIVDVPASITVTQTADPTMVRAGDAVSFTIRVNNGSVEPVTLIDLDDTVFDNLNSECDLPADITIGGSFECVISRDISVDHTNTVTATAKDDEGNEATDSADASVDVINPAVQVVTEASATTAHVGETVTYTVTVENIGDATLTDVAANDDRLGAISLESATLAPGETTSGTATYLIEESDLPGPLTNTVTVNGTPPVGPGVSDTDTAMVHCMPAPAPPGRIFYLPIVQKNHASPTLSLVREHMTVTVSNVQLVVKNVIGVMLSTPAAGAVAEVLF
jgi:uncharacterized repeat protein (TIGR01451 family)